MLSRPAEIEHDAGGRPLPRTAVRFRDLFARHLSRKDIAPPASLACGIEERAVTLRRGEIQPHVRSHVILRYASASIVQGTKVNLRFRESLLGGPPVPLSCGRSLVSRICGYARVRAGFQVYDTKRLPSLHRFETRTPFW